MVGRCVFCDGPGCGVKTITNSNIEVIPRVKALRVTNILTGTVDLEQVFETPVELQICNIKTMLEHVKQNEGFKGVISFA